MVTNSVRACQRCHFRKVRCSGFPGCRGCEEAGVQCEAYIRPRRRDRETARALQEAQSRIRWLEDTLSRELGAEGSSIPAAQGVSPLSVADNGSAEIRMPSGQRGDTLPDTTAEGSVHTSPGNGDPEIGLLALNATGELKYLGPSSGSFFSNYAASLVRGCATSRGRPPQGSGTDQESGSLEAGNARELVNDSTALKPDEVQFLLTSYELWIHPLYPLFRLETLRDVVAKCIERQGSVVAGNAISADFEEQMPVFYMIMALGAMNQASTHKHMQQSPGLGAGRIRGDFSPKLFYALALRYFDFEAKSLRPSVSSIRMILLICVYSTSGSIGSSQWQLSGLAMRMAVDIGLHFALRPWQVTDRKLDDRSRVFWTAYAIEISLAFNLGRPPSIGEEHITTALPLQSSDTASGIHHIKHRRIQARIVSRVYCGAAQLENVTLNQRQEIISDLQHELDMWWDDVPSHDQNEDPPAYPRKYWDRLYHGTTFVIHRVSPLCPHPSVASLEKCIRASGAYIDDVADILRSSHVPLSWMLVQGILFAGLTMLVTARTSFQALASHTGLTFLLIDIPAWSRKCSVSLAIAHERWPEELIAKLEAQFETLADSTLATISKCLTSAQDGHNFRLPSGGSHAQSTLVSDDLHPIQPPLDTVEMNSAMLQDDGWGDMDIFRDFMGMDNSQAFWDIFTSFPELNGPVATGNSQEATSS